MSKVRNKIRENFSQIPNSLILDSNIKYQARFLFVWMASKPDDWDFFMGNIVKELGITEETIRKYMKELIEWGWIEKGEQTFKNGRLGAVEYTLNDIPDQELYCARKKQSQKDSGS